MIVAQEKRRSNIIEYILYMWHLEDVIRSLGFDIVKIREHIIDQYEVSYEDKEEIEIWYRNLIREMQQQGITEQGHLQEIQQLIAEVATLHDGLLKVFQDTNYIQLHQDALPHISMLIEKSNGHAKHPVSACLNGLYGVLLLKMQKKEITQGTQQAMTKVGLLMAKLANFFQLKEQGKLNLPSN